jgi:FkbM family methyltransferase
MNHSVVAFEPLSVNRYFLIETILSNPSFRPLITLFPYGAGVERASFDAFSEPGNVGNSVIGKSAVGASQHAQRVLVDRLDEMLWPTADAAAGLPPPSIPLLKMDVQGFEVNVLRGASRLLAARAIGAIHTELAGAFLAAQGTSAKELCQVMEADGFQLHLDGTPIKHEECAAHEGKTLEVVAILRNTE